MTSFKLVHEFHCDEATFWSTFFDRAFNEELYLRQLGFPRFEILSQTEDDRELVRRVAAQPKLNLPGAVAKVLGPNFAYTEEGRFDKTARVWRWKMTPSTLADRLRQEGSMRVEAAGADRVRRTAELVVEARVFAVGGLLESTAEKQLREGWDKGAAFQERYMSSTR